MSSTDHQKAKKSDAINTINNDKSKPTNDQRKRKNNFRILMNATMQLLSSPPTSPTSINSSDFCCSPSSINSNESSYFSFPEFEIYDEINNNNAQKEVDDMVVQMERFDEMYVNGVRVPFRQI
ncbi:unnamed protein product [Rhizophagus irregularis]|nr:unnamed protein product [Rhizophagus irregularis]CAB4419730.1 unnamed protein product [Rhizophagus irregularis]